jgi:hypothetical protein
MRPTHPKFNRNRGVFPWVNQPWRDTNRSAFIAGVKNGWMYISSPIICLHGIWGNFNLFPLIWKIDEVGKKSVLH